MCQEKVTYLKTGEVAKIMRKEPYSIQTRHEEYGLVAYKVGRELLFEETQVYEAIRSNQVSKKKSSGPKSPMPPIKLVG